MKMGGGEHYPLEIVDIIGIQLDGGIKQEDISKALKGHISDDYIVSTSTFPLALSFLFVKIITSM